MTDENKVRVCPQCGQPVEHPVAYYCAHCGAKLDDAQPEAPAQDAHTP